MKRVLNIFLTMLLDLLFHSITYGILTINTAVTSPTTTVGYRDSLDLKPEKFLNTEPLIQQLFQSTMINVVS